jgi:D-aminopeptidase
VAGVRVGHRSVVRGDDGAPDAVRTGVTTVFPGPKDPWRQPVYAATHILNGYGELIGINSIREWGILESPIVLTSSLLIGRAYDAAVRWIAGRDGDAGEAVMPCVTECDDSFLSAVLTGPIDDADVWAALDAASEGPVEEGCVGSGVGMQAFDFKGGIGTASRVVEIGGDAFTVGVLLQANYGTRAQLQILGVPVGRAIEDLMPGRHHEGSCIGVVATDLPLHPAQLRRVARRVGLGLARTGSVGNDGSGEIFVAFSTATRVPRTAERGRISIEVLVEGQFWREGSPLDLVFEAVAEATEEAALNALWAAETTHGRDGHVLHALPVDRVLALLDGPRR